MSNTFSTYDLTLVNDFAFYQAAKDDNYALVFIIGTRLYNSHHSEDGLTIQERYAIIAAAIDYLTTD